MGFSKKKAKNKRKADAGIGVKAKAKFKQKRQIQSREEVKESKRKASALKDGKPAKAVDSVDDLFASFGGDDEEEDLIAQGGGDSDSEASSAGAFQDIGDGDAGDDLLEEDLGGLDEDAGALHEEELRSIKLKDPDFYRFLVEQDRSLLNFRADDMRAKAPPGFESEEDEGEEDFAAVQEAGQEAAAGPAPRLLTLERFKQLEDSAKASFTSCKAALNAFHTAVRSIGGDPKAQAAQGEDDHVPDDGDEESKLDKQKQKEKQRKKDTKERNRSATAKKRSMQRSLLRIDNEATFSEVLEWSVGNLLQLFRHHGGDLSNGPAVGQSKRAAKKDMKKSKGRQPDDAAKSTAEGLFNPAQLTRYSRVKVLSNIFWEETLFLLNHLVAPQMLEFVLRHCSTPEALSWLWPFKHLRRHFLKRCCALWATGDSQAVRLLAFLFIRNAGAMALHSPDNVKSDTPQLEQLMRSVMKSFADVAGQGYSWRSVSSFRFMENCMVELFRLEDASAYRVGYLCVRQLALLLRNACIASSQTGHESADGHRSAKAQKTAKGRGKGLAPGAAGSKKRATQLKQAQSLVAWPFVRAVYLWTKAIGAVPALRPLAYPLFMIVMGAVKTKLSSLQHFPFVFHLILCLNRLGSSMELFVPVSAHLLKALSVLVESMERGHKKGRGGKGGKEGKGGEEGGEQLANAKAPEIEVLLHFAQNQVNEALTQEAIGSGLCALLTDHLGFLSRSAAFPEVSAPVLLHLRRHSKHCKSEALRRQLRNIVTAAAQSADVVRQRRETLKEAPSSLKLLLLEADGTPLAKQRTQLLQRRAAEERSRVEAELRELAASKASSSKGKRKADAESAEAVPEGKKAAKRRKQSEAAVAREDEEKAAARREAARLAPVVVALAGGAARKTDMLEEMEFSDGEE